MFKRILIANRGEIAIRVINACQEMGIESLAIFSEPDKAARHVALADSAVLLTGQPGKAYLDARQIINIALAHGAQAIHPGYGFLSENADFAQICLDAGLKFIGPRPDVIRLMGSKIEARKIMEAAGVPVVPGTTTAIASVSEIRQFATKYGYPFAIKAAAGGGGRGLSVVRNADEIESAFGSVQRQGESYFGSPLAYLEKYLENAHHVEVQVIGDESGNLVHLFERDCSVQRRHQKLIEETPAPLLTAATREKLLTAALNGARQLKYSSAGTLEFLVAGENCYFLEVNTRIQVEHPITEAITGIDIVKEQIAIAAGERLSFRQAQIKPHGHAIEFRINAEDPYNNFMPCPGTISTYVEPKLPWLRIDSACYAGLQILPYYDSLLAKLIVRGDTRKEAIERGMTALRQFQIDGLSTTIPFHLAILQDECFNKGEVDTKYVESKFMHRFVTVKDEKQKLPAIVNENRANLHSSIRQALEHSGDQKLQVDCSAPRQFEVAVGNRTFQVTVREIINRNLTDELPAHCTAFGEREAVGGSAASSVRTRPATGRLGSPASDNKANIAMPPKNAYGDTASGGHKGDYGAVVATMNGLVKEVFVKQGDAVKQGQKLLIFEAMKMESEVVAPVTGTIVKLNTTAGDTIHAGATFLTIT